MSEKSFLWLIVIVSLSLGLSGSFLAMSLAKAKKSWLNLGLGFGSGFLLAIAIAEMLPEAAKVSEYAYLMALLGFVFAYALEHIFKATGVFHSHGSDEDDHPEDHPEPMGFIAFFAISFHSLIDGIAIATALLSSFRLGIFVAIAVIVHKLPDGFTLGSLLVAKEYSKKMLLGLSFVLALATPVGAIFSYYLLKGFSVNAGLFLGLSSGLFIYISTAHMLPEAHHARPPAHLQISSSFIVGVILGLGPLLIK